MYLETSRMPPDEIRMTDETLVASAVEGVYEIVGTSFVDQRGSFVNAFRRNESDWTSTWGERIISQVNISYTACEGSVRGLHLQIGPHNDAKVVRCIQGCVWDVAVDLRPRSPTHGQWHAVELSAKAANALFIPEGCAHGFQVLEAESVVLYLHSGVWVPAAERGVRYDDPQLAIPWPLPPTVISERDLSLPLLESWN
jgi:dTDP-4-dehydrorhamnose 3,5-epimerase